MINWEWKPVCGWAGGPGRSTEELEQVLWEKAGYVSEEAVSR